MRPKHLIDFHVHCYPDHVAGKALAALTERYRVRPHSDGTVAGLQEQMARTGVEISVILPVATKAAQVQSINDWAASIQSEEITAFGALHPALTDPEAEVEEHLLAQCRGPAESIFVGDLDPNGSLSGLRRSAKIWSR